MSRGRRSVMGIILWQDWGNGAGEWKEEAENELKQVGGRTSLQTTEVFQVLAVKEGRKRGSEEGLNSVRGQEKIQYSVTQVALLTSRIATFAVQGKCNRLSGSGVPVRGGFQECWSRWEPLTLWISSDLGRQAERAKYLSLNQLFFRPGPRQGERVGYWGNRL